jgi:hypothetical protein
LQVHRDQAHHVGVDEGWCAGEQLVDDDAEGVDVGAGVDGFAAGDLGGEVAGLGGDLGGGVRADAGGDALEEGMVDDLDRLLLALAADRVAVAGLQGAEDDALAVEGVDELTEADKQAAAAAPRQATAAAEHGGQVVAVDEVGDDEDLAVEGHAGVGDVDEVDEGAGAQARDLFVAIDAGVDARQLGVLGQRGGQDAHRDRDVREHVVGAEHRARRALTDERCDAVPIGQDRPQERRSRLPRGGSAGLRLNERRHAGQP